MNIARMHAENLLNRETNLGSAVAAQRVRVFRLELYSIKDRTAFAGSNTAGSGASHGSLEWEFRYRCSLLLCFFALYGCACKPTRIVSTPDGSNLASPGFGGIPSVNPKTGEPIKPASDRPSTSALAAFFVDSDAAGFSITNMPVEQPKSVGPNSPKIHFPSPINAPDSRKAKKLCSLSFPGHHRISTLCPTNRLIRAINLSWRWIGENVRSQFLLDQLPF